MSQRLPEPGDLIADKYLVESFLGRGGMGAVYVVSHRVTGKRLALKSLLPEHLADPEIVERFLRESQAAGRIQHRHVVDVFDVGRDGSVLYLVMPLLDGRPLSVLLQEGRLSLEEALAVLLRAMEGVDAAHQQGIVHRDLKPDNIFVCVGPSGRHDDPRVLDFGISKLEDDLSRPLTRSGMLMGTPHYMSFEQLNSQRDLDQRVDVYAMGVILYEALSGGPPHVAESVGQLAIRMMSTPPKALSELRPDLPAGLADVVMKAIARERDERYPDMRAFIDALAPFVPAHAPSLVQVSSGTPLRGTVSPSHTEKRRSVEEEATVPFHPPTPRELLNTAYAHTAKPLATGNEEHTPPRVIAQRPKAMLWLTGAPLLLASIGVALWLLRPARQPSIAAPPSSVTAPHANKVGAPPELPAAGLPGLGEGSDATRSEDGQVRPAGAEPLKKRRKRRRKARANANVPPAPNVRTYVDGDGGVWEEEEIVEGESPAADASTTGPVPADEAKPAAAPSSEEAAPSVPPAEGRATPPGDAPSENAP